MQTIEIFWEWLKVFSNTAQKMKFSTKDFFSKCDHIRSFCADISFFVLCKWYFAFAYEFSPIANCFIIRITKYLNQLTALDRQVSKNQLWL